MEHDLFIYEQPLTELMELCLRLESLFNTIQHHLPGNSPWHSHNTLQAILQLVALLEQKQCKSRFIQEIQRYTTKFQLLQETPHVNKEKLDELLIQLTQSQRYLQAQPGKLNEPLFEHPLLTCLINDYQRNKTVFCCDLPWYHFWLSQPVNQRISDMTVWLTALSPLEQMTSLLLRLARSSASARIQTAKKGIYQANFNQANPYQLIRIGLSQHACVFPHIHVGQRRFMLRFMQYTLQKEPVQTSDDIEFEFIGCYR